MCLQIRELSLLKFFLTKLKKNGDLKKWNNLTQITEKANPSQIVALNWFTYLQILHSFF